MSVRNLGVEVLKHSYAKLKLLGFSKNGAMFSRERDAYVERYLLEGSHWNSGEEPWFFTVNVGVFFPEIPAFEGAKGIWRHCHAVGSAVHLLANDVRDFEVCANTVEEVANSVVETICASSMVLPTLLAAAKPRAVQGLISPLPVPQTWIGNNISINTD